MLRAVALTGSEDFIGGATLILAGATVLLAGFTAYAALRKPFPWLPDASTR